MSNRLTNVKRTIGTSLRPRLYGEKLSQQEDHPASRVNFTERLYEKNVDPSAQAKS